MPTEVLPTPPPALELRADPFTALHYHFGMLLGVEDLETEQAYHRGQGRLATAWLHGPGVVWGLAVTYDPDSSEVRIAPGLGYDGAGAALRVDQELCVSLPRWFAVGENRRDLQIPEPSPGEPDPFDLHVVLSARACLARQVPAMAEPCDGTATGTAYSRVVETVHAALVAGAAPARREPYHRLRVLFGVAEAVLPADQDVVDARAAVLARPAADRPAAWLAALRRFATVDVTQLRPPDGPDGSRLRMPAPADEGIVLAELRQVRMRHDADGWHAVAATVDLGVRRNHIATSTIQELLCGPPDVDSEGGGGGGGGAPEVEDAGGPRIDRESLEVQARTIRFRTDKPLAGASVTPDACAITSFSAAEGWNRYEIRTITPDAGGQRVTVSLRESIAGDLLRIVVHGTGPTPMLGTDLVPLAGAAGSPPSGAHDGRDFVHQVDRRG